jgi:hypothetical protein
VSHDRGTVADSMLDRARRSRDDEGGTFVPAPELADEPGHITDERSSMLTAYVLGALAPHAGAGRAS